MTERQNLYIASREGKIYYYDWQKDNLSVAFDAPVPETMMGLCRKDDTLWIGGSSYLYKTKVSGGKIQHNAKDIANFSARDTRFHQMNMRDNRIFVSVTGENAVYVFSEDLILVDEVKVSPPNRLENFSYGSNYNHINNVFPYQKRLYVNLNWMTTRQHGYSGVAVLDESLKEIDRFQYGWESHNFCIVDGQKVCLCGSSAPTLNRPIHHPHQTGLMVGGELVWEHPPEQCFCRALVIDDDHIYIGGEGLSHREGRNDQDGFIFILDREYNQIEEKRFEKTGGFLGFIGDGKDYSSGIL